MCECARFCLWVCVSERVYPDECVRVLCMFAYINVFMIVCVCVCLCACVCMFVFICECAYVSVCVCQHVCAYVSLFLFVCLYGRHCVSTRACTYVNPRVRMCPCTYAFASRRAGPLIPRPAVRPPPPSLTVLAHSLLTSLHYHASLPQFPKNILLLQINNAQWISQSPFFSPLTPS